MGLTNSDVNGNQSHVVFTAAGGLDVIDLDDQDQILSLATRAPIGESGVLSATAAKTWVAGPPTRLTLDPASADNPILTEHCVTATVEDAYDNPVPGIITRFTVSGTHDASAPEPPTRTVSGCSAGPGRGRDRTR